MLFHSVVIVGFSDYNELSAAMEEVIKREDNYLFTVCVGSTEDSSLPFGDNQPELKPSLAEEWAKNNGAPVFYFYRKSVDEIMRELRKVVDYIVIKVDDNTPNVWKRFLEEMRREGKHGFIVR